VYVKMRKEFTLLILDELLRFDLHFYSKLFCAFFYTLLSKRYIFVTYKFRCFKFSRVIF
jgi:hypothetical protein